MHTVHHTNAVILKSTPSGEYNKLLWLFTEEFGLVVATVTGVRKPGAKLQTQLIDYAFITADLVRGKDVWRLVSATLLHNPLAGNHTHPFARGYVRALATLERFLIGEGDHPELFAHITEIGESFREETISGKYYDTLAIWRALVHLGYIAVEEDEQVFFEDPFFDVLGRMDDVRTKAMITVVNEAITQTHL